MRRSSRRVQTNNLVRPCRSSRRVQCNPPCKTLPPSGFATQALPPHSLPRTNASSIFSTSESGDCKQKSMGHIKSYSWKQIGNNNQQFALCSTISSLYQPYFFPVEFLCQIVFVRKVGCRDGRLSPGGDITHQSRRLHHIHCQQISPLCLLYFQRHKTLQK